MDNLDERLNDPNERPRKITQKIINVKAAQIVRTGTDLK